MENDFRALVEKMNEGVQLEEFESGSGRESSISPQKLLEFFQEEGLPEDVKISALPKMLRDEGAYFAAKVVSVVLAAEKKYKRGKGAYSQQITFEEEKYYGEDAVDVAEEVLNCLIKARKLLTEVRETKKSERVGDQMLEVFEILEEGGLSPADIGLLEKKPEELVKGFMAEDISREELKKAA